MTIGTRVYWPKAPGWLHGRVYGDVDQPDGQVERGYRKPVWSVQWAETERHQRTVVTVPGQTKGQIEVELWEVRFKLMGWRRSSESLYVVDSTVWLRLDNTTGTAFFQTMSFGRLHDAEAHYDRLRTRLPTAVK